MGLKKVWKKYKKYEKAELEKRALKKDYRKKARSLQEDLAGKYKKKPKIKLKKFSGKKYLKSVGGRKGLPPLYR